MMERDVEILSRIVVDAAFGVHRDLGPGLLEAVYQRVLAGMLEKRGLVVESELPVAFEYEGICFNDGLRVDILVNKVLVVELKSVEQIAAVHRKQVLTYLRLMKLPLGLLINFGAATFREGCQRIVNGEFDKGSSILRVNKPA
jgi:iron complex transport system substrate-binding protein